MPQGIPCLNDDTFLLEVIFQLLLLIVRMHLGLQNYRLYLTDIQNLTNLRLAKIGQTDGLDLALFVGFLHQLVTGDIVSSGLVDEQQVNVVGVQPLQCLFHSIRLLVEGRPQLGFQKNLLSGHAGLLHCTTYGLFIDIGVCRVDQAIATRQHIEDGCFRLVRGQKKGSNTCHRHLNSIVQSNIFHY